MKKILAGAILALLALHAHAQSAYALRLDQRNATNSAYASKFTPPDATATCVLTIAPSSAGATPLCMPLGSSITTSGGVVNVPVTTGPQGEVGPQGPAGTPAPITLRLRAQTDTGGSYTWTFPTGSFSGVPVIGVAVEDASGSGASWAHVITAASSTSMTVQLTKTTAVTVQGVDVLGISTTPQAYVHLIAIEP